MSSNESTMTGAVSGVPAEAALATAIHVEGVRSDGTHSLLLAIARSTREAIDDVIADCGDNDPSVLASNIASRLTASIEDALPALREGIAAEVLGPVRKLVESTRRGAGSPPLHETWIYAPALIDALSAPVQAETGVGMATPPSDEPEQWHDVMKPAAPVQAAEEFDVERIRAAIRLVQPDHLTPVGARIIEQALGGGTDG